MTVTGFCALCQSPIQPGEPAGRCPACQAPFHRECWEQNGGCGVYGCPQVPPTEKLHEMEIPVSYWGRQTKPCPNCETEILAAAIRCRQCGAVFQSAAPQSADQYRRHLETARELPRLRRSIAWLFVFCVLPLTAPVAGLWGLFWCAGRWREIRALPSLFGALARLALVIGLGQTMLMVLMIVLYNLSRS